MPQIITAADLGLHFVDVGFGELGPERDVTGHWAAVSARNFQDEIALLRRFHREHKAKGWGGEGYHFAASRFRPVIFCLRPTAMKGAHVGGHNTGNIGITTVAGPGDVPSRVFAANIRWLAANAHTKRLPAAHRTDRDLRQARWRGHNEFPDHRSNQCPGSFLRTYQTKGAKR